MNCKKQLPTGIGPEKILKQYTVSYPAFIVIRCGYLLIVLNMNCFKFNQLAPKSQLQYIYDHCRLLDFIIQTNGSKQNALCLYHNGEIFVEVSFDGLEGDRVKGIRSYPTLDQLSHWYHQVDITAAFQNVTKD